MNTAEIQGLIHEISEAVKRAELRGDSWPLYSSQSKNLAALGIRDALAWGYGFRPMEVSEGYEIIEALKGALIARAIGL